VPKEARVAREIESVLELDERGGVVATTIELASELVLALCVAGEGLGQRWIVALGERRRREREDKREHRHPQFHLIVTSKPVRGVEPVAAGGVIRLGDVAGVRDGTSGGRCGGAGFLSAGVSDATKGGAASVAADAAAEGKGAEAGVAPTR